MEYYNGSAWSTMSSSLSTRAWVTFDAIPASPTISGSANVSSVTKDSTGIYTVNFTAAVTTANYATVTQTTTYSTTNSGAGMYVIGDVITGPTLKTSSQLRVGTFANVLAPTDYNYCNVIILY
jgi:hypothetical protein